MGLPAAEKLGELPTDKLPIWVLHAILPTIGMPVGHRAMRQL